MTSDRLTKNPTTPVELKKNTFENKRWIRLTRSCNNHCLFCHDSGEQDGSFVPTAEVKALIAENPGAIPCERLVLSGGEPTIHPDFFDIIDFARRTGYRKIQTVSNGRAFAYRNFVEKAIEAGLSEATISVHGHTPELHDMLVCVPGAFAQTIFGIKNLLDSGRIIVNADIVANGLNHRHLFDIVAFLARIGVCEFDLLQVIPFGRAYENRRRIFYTGTDESQELLRALHAAEEAGLTIWTNRFNPTLLESMEHYIQPPSKLLGEIEVTAEAFDRLANERTPMSCRGERCSRCFMEQYCAALEDLSRSFTEDGPRHIAVDADAASAETIDWIAGRIASDSETVLHLESRIGGPLTAGLEEIIRPDTRLIIKCPTPATACQLLSEIGRLGADNVLSISVESLDRIEELPALPPPGELEISLSPEVCAAAAERPELMRGLVRNAVFSLHRVETFPMHGTRDFGPATFMTRHPEARVRDVPHCIAGPLARHAPMRRPFPSQVLAQQGRIDFRKFARHFIARENYTKSSRCRHCAMTENCCGLPLNYAHHFGYSIMKQIQPPGP